MRKKQIHLLSLMLLLVTLLLLSGLALATGPTGPRAAPESYTLAWTAAGASGYRGSGGAYTLGASAGQAEAGTGPGTGGVYRLQGGFWAGARAPAPVVYLPILFAP